MPSRPGGRVSTAPRTAAADARMPSMMARCSGVMVLPRLPAAGVHLEPRVPAERVDLDQRAAEAEGLEVSPLLGAPITPLAPGPGDQRRQLPRGRPRPQGRAEIGPLLGVEAEIPGPVGGEPAPVAGPTEGRRRRRDDPDDRPVGEAKALGR